MLIAPYSPGPEHSQLCTHTVESLGPPSVGVPAFAVPGGWWPKGGAGFPAGGVRPPRAGSGGWEGWAEVSAGGAAARSGGRGRQLCFPSDPVAPEGTWRPGLMSQHPTEERRQPPGTSLPRPRCRCRGLTQLLPRRLPGARVAPAALRCPRPRAPRSSGHPERCSPQLPPPWESRHRPPRRAGGPGQTARPGAGKRTASAPGCSGG